MADKEGVDTETSTAQGIAIEAAAAAGAETAAVIAQVQESAEVAIEIAQAETAAAEALAQKLTEAALATELGRMVSDLSGRVEQCQTKITTLETQIAETMAALTVALTSFQELKSASQPVLIQPAPAEPIVEIPALTEGASDPTQGASAEITEAGNPPPQASPKKKRFV